MPQMQSLVLGPRAANQDLIPNPTAAPSFPGNVTFNQTTWNVLVGTRR